MTVEHEWFLEGSLTPGGERLRLALDHFPFRIGRQKGLSLSLKTHGISRLHGEINWDGSQLWVMDLDSTNGTFVNRQQATERCPIKHGDTLQFADLAFRVVNAGQQQAASAAVSGDDGADAVALLDPFDQLLADEQITVLFQPMIERAAHTLFGFEVLTRGASDTLPQSPMALFELAQSSSRQVELARMMRKVGVEAAAASGHNVPFFLNIHPREMLDPDNLLDDIQSLRERQPNLLLVLEIHEAAVADRDHLAEVDRRLKAMDVLLAFDDFGTEQARLTALAEVTPDFVKLRGSLMHDIDTSPPAHQQTVRMLVSYAQGMNVQVVAEGINTDAEARFCEDLKIDLLQGFRYGEPEDLTP
ncbi:MAG: EAL domain-containing protein [Lysobacterales bacterium]